MGSIMLCKSRESLFVFPSLFDAYWAARSLLHSHLANLANRSYVFEDYVWSWSPVRWTIYDYALRPARLPLNAFIAGPTAGQPSHSPPAVSKKFWQAVCPPEKKTVIKRPDSPFEADATFIVNWWLGILAETEDECVEIDARDYPVFDASLRLPSIFQRIIF